MEPRLFLDTNVMIDLLGEREPHYHHAAVLASLADNGQLQMVTSSLSFVTSEYVLCQYENKEAVLDKLRKFKTLTEVATVDDPIIDKALHSGFNDFEDAVQYHSALKSNCQIIITRNKKDFKLSEIPVMSPKEFLEGNHL
jgi:predicted nucleic acid-binding protein